MDKLFLLSDIYKNKELPTFRRPIYEKVRWESKLYSSLLGARGVGKTTLLLQRLNELDLPSSKALYIDLGDIYFTQNRLVDTALAFADQGGQYLFIDEVHRYGLQSWATEIKTIYDVLGDRLHVVFTGSSQTRILLRQADLSRRVLFHAIRGFSFREFLEVTKGITLPPIELDELTDNHDAYLQRHRNTLRGVDHGLFQDYLQYGYYPSHLDDPAAFRIQLNRMVQTVLDMDVPYFSDTPNVKFAQLSKLLQAVATSVPFKPNFTKLGERTGLRRQFVEEYLISLQRAQLIQLLPADASGVASLSKPEKIYLDNSNLVHALSPAPPSIGTIRETFFANQMTALTDRVELIPPHLSIPKRGDFVLSYQDRKRLFEIGGPNKEAKQIGTGIDQFTVVDALKVAGKQRLPLWLFGFLY